MTEQMPIRKQQLYETYGAQGPIPLIPGGSGVRPVRDLGPRVRLHLNLFVLS